MVKMLTVLVRTISNSQIFLLLAFFFSKNTSIFAIFYYQSFKDSLTNAIVSFEQLGPGKYFSNFSKKTINPFG